MSAPVGEQQATTEWAVEVGCEGRWITCGGPTPDRAVADELLGWCRVHAAPSVAYRLARITTTVTRTIEDA